MKTSSTGVSLPRRCMEFDMGQRYVNGYENGALGSVQETRQKAKVEAAASLAAFGLRRVVMFVVRAKEGK